MKIPRTPPAIGSVSFERLFELVTSGRISDDRYLHWDQLRRKPAPEGLSHEEWWAAIKLRRSQNARTTPLRDKSGRPFIYALPDSVLEKLHWLDSHARGQLASEVQINNSEDRDRYIVRSLMEEAITSSQLEGASTTRKVAVELLRTGRRPKDPHETMILNNYRAMQTIIQNADKDLAVQDILNLHGIVTENTLNNDGASGRFQTADEDRVNVVDDRTQTILHRPPDAVELTERADTLCRFANGQDDGGFIHPVLRAIFLHFGLAYDHPFEDGNGRSARALFYWAMLRQGYWLFEFISISRLLRRAPAQYGMAFQYTETDGNDLTYFALHQLTVIEQAINDLHEWLARKTSEVQQLEATIADTRSLNHRQRALLAHSLRHPAHRYTIRSHQRSHAIAYATARADLYQLARHNWLTRRKSGRRMVFGQGARLK